MLLTFLKIGFTKGLVVGEFPLEGDDASGEDSLEGDAALGEDSLEGDAALGETSLVGDAALGEESLVWDLGVAKEGLASCDELLPLNSLVGVFTSFEDMFLLIEGLLLPTLTAGLFAPTEGLLPLPPIMWLLPLEPVEGLLALDLWVAPCPTWPITAILISTLIFLGGYLAVSRSKGGSFVHKP